MFGKIANLAPSANTTSNGRIVSTLAILAMAACLPAAQADTLNFATSFLTDANQPASATASFTYLGPNSVSVTLTDTTKNPMSDAPNLAEIGFSFSGLTGLNGSSATGATGTVVSGLANNTALTLNPYTGGGSPWALSYQSSGWWGAAGYELGLVPPATKAPAGCLANTVPYSIVGAPRSNGTYSGLPAGSPNSTIGSANAIGNGCDGDMFYQSATFMLTITGLNATNFDSLSTVAFGFGPDAPGKPDGDDWAVGYPTSITTSTTPEPASMVLMGAGLIGIALLRRSKNASSSSVR